MLLTIDARIELFKKQFPKEKITLVQERQGTDHSVLEINHIWMCKSSKTQDGIPLITYTFYRLGNKQRSKLIFSIAQFLSQLHEALNPEEIETLKLAKTDWPWSVEKLQAQRHLLKDNKDMLEVFDGIMKIYEDEASQSFQPVLIHNDMDIRNIIVDPMTGQLRGIIDFTDVAFDDPSLDLRMRHDNPIELVRAVALVYAMMHKTPEYAQKIYGYYFATEFSRYFQYLEEGKTQQAQKTFNEIVKSIRDFLISHDDCNDDECAHGTSQDVQTATVA